MTFGGGDGGQVVDGGSHVALLVTSLSVVQLVDQSHIRNGLLANSLRLNLFILLCIQRWDFHTQVLSGKQN